MEKPAGLLTREELLDAIAHDSIETVLVAVPDWYGRLMGKRLTACCQHCFSNGWFKVKNRAYGEDNPSKVSYAFQSDCSTQRSSSFKDL